MGFIIYVSSPVILISGPLPNGSNGTVSATVSGSSYTFSAKIGQNYTVTASKEDYDSDSMSVSIQNDVYSYDVALVLDLLQNIRIHLSYPNYTGSEKLNMYAWSNGFNTTQTYADENNIISVTGSVGHAVDVHLDTYGMSSKHINGSTYYYNDNYCRIPSVNGYVICKLGVYDYYLDIDNIYDVTITYSLSNVSSPIAYSNDTSAEIEVILSKKYECNGVDIVILETTDESSHTVTFPTNNTRTMPPTVDYTTGGSLVDLGLPSGLLWASCNFGSANEMDSGLYFQYGDTNGYTIDNLAKITKRTGTFIHNGITINWTVGQIDNAKFGSRQYVDHPLCTNKPVVIGENPNFNNLGDSFGDINPNYDPLRVNGTATSGNRLPTYEEAIELIDNTDHIKVDINGNEISTFGGAYGWKLKSKVNNNYIIMPFTASIYERFRLERNGQIRPDYDKVSTTAVRIDEKSTDGYVSLLTTRRATDSLHMIFGGRSNIKYTDRFDLSITNVYTLYNVRGVK